MDTVTEFAWCKSLAHAPRRHPASTLVQATGAPLILVDSYREGRPLCAACAVAVIGQLIDRKLHVQLTPLNVHDAPSLLESLAADIAAEPGV